MIPPGYKLNQSGQLVACGSNVSTPPNAISMVSNASQLRLASNQYFVNPNNGQFVYFMGQPQTSNQQPNKTSNQRKSGSGKDKDSTVKPVGPQYSLMSSRFRHYFTGR